MPQKDSPGSSAEIGIDKATDKADKADQPDKPGADKPSGSDGVDKEVPGKKVGQLTDAIDKMKQGVGEKQQAEKEAEAAMDAANNPPTPPPQKEPKEFDKK